MCIRDSIDIVFCNESEVLSLFQENDLQRCQEFISSICELVIITLGSKGSLVINRGKSEKIKPKLLGKIIDTTGAGDLYAGGFIHGLINNCSLKKCGEIGSLCAGHIITQLGSRSNINLQNLLQENLV